MHDTYVLDKLCKSIIQLCEDNNIIKIKKLNMTVSNNSHIQGDMIYSELVGHYRHIIEKDAEILIRKDNIDEHVVILDSIVGDVIE